MPSQREVRKRRIQAANTASGQAVRGRQPRRDRRRRLLVGVVAVIVTVMMVASLAVGLFASGI